MTKTYLLLGGNVGDVAATFEKAKALIKTNIGEVKDWSSPYQTGAWGNIKQNDYLNQVLLVKTGLDAEELLFRCLQIEQELGRTREVKNAPRTIDIDILFYGKAVIKKEGLEIPHPRIAARRFVLTPLNEIAPRLVHPALNKTIHLLFKECQDPLSVKKL